MVSFEEAKKLALNCWGEIDYVVEHPEAYVFSKYNDFSFGGNGPVVVLKEDGECINMVCYVDEGFDQTVVHEGHITDFA